MSSYDYGIKSYDVSLTFGTAQKVLDLTQKKRISVSELVEKFVRMGVMIVEMQENSNSKLIVKDSCGEREMKIFT